MITGFEHFFIVLIVIAIAFIAIIGNAITAMTNILKYLVYAFCIGMVIYFIYKEYKKYLQHQKMSEAIFYVLLNSIVTLMEITPLIVLTADFVVEVAAMNIFELLLGIIGFAITISLVAIGVVIASIPYLGCVMNKRENGNITTNYFASLGGAGLTIILLGVVWYIIYRVGFTMIFDYFDLFPQPFRIIIEGIYRFFLKFF